MAMALSTNLDDPIGLLVEKWAFKGLTRWSELNLTSSKPEDLRLLWCITG